MPRKIVRIASSATYTPESGLVLNTYSLCDDHTVWVLGDGKWVRLPDIPQDAEVIIMPRPEEVTTTV